MKRVRIFISSPGDVHEERIKAEQVIADLQSNYAAQASLEPVMWEDLALPATASFQESIDVVLTRQPIDIAVFILWSRLGSAIGSSMKRADGTLYQSGTQREFELILGCFEQSGNQRPLMLAYARDDETTWKQSLTERHRDELEEMIRQRKMAESFIKENFHDAGGHNLRAYHSYHEPVGFAQRLRTHLRAALDEFLVVQDQTPRWSGSPYRSLEVFDIDHASIFFGRAEESCDVMDRLRKSHEDGCGFIVIIGASGSGKSSLARAGVAAALVQHAYDERIRAWRYGVVIPSLLSHAGESPTVANKDSGIFLGLTQLLFQLLPELKDSGSKIPDIASSFAKDPQVTITLSILPALAKADTAEHGPVRVLLLLDQMEELWTDRRITDQDREKFFETLEALARCGHFDILATIRSDFYAQAQASPAFLRLKGQTGHIDLVPPGAAALQRMITEPARMAGLHFERDERSGRTLDQSILEDAMRDPSALPLLQYALAELYDARNKSDRMLTFEAYRRMRGIEGAVGQRAVATFATLPTSAQAALGELLPLLITVDPEVEQNAVRRRAPLSALTATPDRQALTQAFIDARFLTTDRDGANAVASFAHEALLRRWDALVNWIGINRNQLRLRARVEHNEKHWQESNRDLSLLLAPGLPLDEGRQLLKTSENFLSASTKQYIEISLRRAARLRHQRMGLVAALLIGLAFLGMSAKRYFDRQQQQAVATRLVEGLLQADTTQISGTLINLKPFHGWAVPLLQQAYEQSDADSNAKLHAALGLMSSSAAADRGVIDYLKERLLTVTPVQFGPVRTILANRKSEFTPNYWQLALDDTQPPTRRFHAACTLAAFDSSHTNWDTTQLSQFLAEQLVAVSPTYINQYQELVRPIATKLVPPLSAIFRDKNRGELARTLATTLLADYAAADSDTLVELIVVADVSSDKTLFPVLQKHRESAIKQLASVLERQNKPDWRDAALNPRWASPTAELRSQVESAHGLIHERFAFCLDMPWRQFLETVEVLRSCGYRPTRVRPWMSGEDMLASAVWARDNRRWELQTELTAADLPSVETAAERNGLRLADLARMPTDGKSTKAQPDTSTLVTGTGNANPAANSAPDSAAGRWVALWSEATDDNQSHRVGFDLSESQILLTRAKLADQGFVTQNTIHVWTDAQGQRRYTGIWSNHGAVSELRPSYAGFELVHQPHWDVAASKAETPADPLEAYRSQLLQIAGQSAEGQDDPQVRHSRAVAHYQLGNLEAALTDLDFVAGKSTASPLILQYRALTLARLGKADEAQQALTSYLATDASAWQKEIVQIQSQAWSGATDKAWEHLQSVAAAVDHDANEWFELASASAVAAIAAQGKDDAQATKFIDRCLELLQQAIAAGYSDAQQLKSHADFASLHDDPRFLNLLTQIESPGEFAGLWRAEVDFESKLLPATPADELIATLPTLLAQGYRPIALAMSPPNDEDEPLFTLLLHIPHIPDAARDDLAKSQAAAATALLRLAAPEHMWALLQDRPDARAKSYLLHRLSEYGVDPQNLLTHLSNESDASRRRSLIIGLGQFARVKLLSADQSHLLLTDLTRRYADEPNSGVHGACEWTLRQLGGSDAIARVRKEFATGESVGDRRWYVTKTGVDTNASISLAVVDGHDAFLMGSPVSEAVRIGGPAGKNEIRHRRQIGRTFAIGHHEITVAQFKAFRVNHDFNRNYARENEAPANAVNWYAAAQYCNWLSEHEGLAPDQWCYDPNQPFGDGMRLYPDYLQRTGYRLPTEAEWEFACRAGTTTARYYGETEELLGEYAWYTKTSHDKWMQAVGYLKPNALGLFDMQGNALEWCHDQAALFKTDIAVVSDEEISGIVSNTTSRMLRGGAFDYSATDARSASRYGFLPDGRDFNFGFRVARTLR